MLSIWILLYLTTLGYMEASTINYIPPKKFEKIVMDVDAGADDAFAIAVVLKNEQFSNGPPLIAVTCVHGNTVVQNVKINVLRTLTQLKRVDIPVYVGANESLFSTAATDSFFGHDGFGDFYNPMQILPKPQKEHAVTALIRLVNANPGQITLMALGPLTNIALAIKLYPYFIQKLKQLVILGGAVNGIGNIKPGIEFNALNDPEALHITLMKSNYRQVTMFPWDTVFKANISMNWRRNTLGIINSGDIQFFNMAESADKSTSWNHGDAMAIASYIWPITVKDIRPLRVSAVPCGEARGGVLVDFFRESVNVTSSNVKLVLGFDSEEFKAQLLRHFQYDSDDTKRRYYGNN